MKYALSRLLAICLLAICFGALSSVPAMAKNGKQQAPLTVKNIGVTREGDGELLCLDFSEPYVPELSTIDDAEKPRVFFDVQPVAQWKGKATYDVNGTFIHQVRTGHTEKEQRLRVVLDLDPRYNYMVKPSFNDEYNLFCIAISARSIRE